MENGSTVGPARLLGICSLDPVLSLLALKQNAEIDYGHYVGDELPFLGYNFKSKDVSNVAAT